MKGNEVIAPGNLYGFLAFTQIVYITEIVSSPTFVSIFFVLVYFIDGVSTLYDYCSLSICRKLA